MHLFCKICIWLLFDSIDAKIGRETGKSLTFPDRGGSVPAWVEDSGSQIYIPEESLGGIYHTG